MLVTLSALAALRFSWLVEARRLLRAHVRPGSGPLASHGARTALALVLSTPGACR